MNYQMKIFFCFAMLINIVNNKCMEKEEIIEIPIPLEDNALRSLCGQYPDKAIELTNMGGVPRFSSSEKLLLGLVRQNNSVPLRTVQEEMEKKNYNESCLVLKHLLSLRYKTMEEQDKKGTSGSLCGLSEEEKKNAILQHAPKNETLLKILGAIHTVEQIDIGEEEAKRQRWYKVSSPSVSLVGFDKSKKQEGVIYFTSDEKHNEGIIIQLVKYKPFEQDKTGKFIFCAFLGQTEGYAHKGYIKNLLEQEMTSILKDMEDSDGKVKLYTWIKSKRACEKDGSQYLGGHYSDYLRKLISKKTTSIEISEHSERPNFDIISVIIDNNNK